MDPTVENIIRFSKLLHELQHVTRALYANGEDRKENDAEHQYQLAMMAWYIIDFEKLDLDKDLVMKYSLVHDFVEVYAGDTYFYGNRSGKEEREKIAAQKLEEEFPEFKDLHKFIKDYEAQKDNEARFVYALDKLLPCINIYVDEGRTWKEYGITRKMIVDNKSKKVSGSPHIKNYYDKFIVRLKEEEPDLFNCTS